MNGFWLDSLSAKYKKAPLLRGFFVSDREIGQIRTPYPKPSCTNNKHQLY